MVFGGKGYFPCCYTKPFLMYYIAPIAQRIEHLPSKQGITVRFCMGVFL